MKFNFDFPAGELQKAQVESKSAAAQRVTAATRKAADDLQRVLRDQVRSAGLGPGLEKAWRVEHWPKGDKASLHPAALVWSKATALHRAFGQGATITARVGQWLVIPLPEAIARGWDRALVDRKLGALSGAAMPRRFAQTRLAARALGELRFVAINNGKALLVANPPKRGRGRVKHSTDPGRKDIAMPAGERGIPLFVLVRQTRVAKLLDFSGAAKSAGTSFNALLRATVNAGQQGS
ncbi:hypothetical protein FHP25_25010 [Vineibacter terrae]|uniref:Uncharacterized protein n=1 Tax=Vineibacter terrae TaxID=2586908 RepID=A0A5C8PFI2_9HYPH|nr:DUF6441 family protein [Vineibacter terrae]TXL72559.1 hypothetical protein FHP25_25010 [Vineibacter terrae]